MQPQDKLTVTDLPEDDGSYVVINNQVWFVFEHETDFAIEDECEVVDAHISQSAYKLAKSTPLASRMCRVRVDSKDRDSLMTDVRQRFVAHHIYQLKREENGVEFVQNAEITDRIHLRLKNDDPEELLRILQEHKLLLEKWRGTLCVLKVTNDSGCNPIKVANAIYKRDGVWKCKPEFLFPMKPSTLPDGVPDLQGIAGQHALFNQQWYLDATTSAHDGSHVKDITVSINAHQAWTRLNRLGDPDVVIVVIDDGFDINHPAFSKTNKFVEGIPVATPGLTFHGTCVAGLSSANGDQILGVAPGCSLRLMRLPFNAGVRPPDVIEALEKAAEKVIPSQKATVINCSFSTGLTVAPFVTDDDDFMERIKVLTDPVASGGKGLIIVFAAGNDDGPIRLSADENKNGVTVSAISDSETKEFPKGTPIHGGYPEIPDIIVVGGVTAFKRKATYSNWGKEVTVLAPVSDKPGDGTPKPEPIITANNSTIDRPPSLAPGVPYTRKFPGTSAAAPIVSGVIALMLSAYPNLTPQEVQEILRDKADRALETTLTEEEKRNLQDFVNQQPFLFGVGKVDALAAVEAAFAKKADAQPPAPPPGGPPAGGNS